MARPTRVERDSSRVAARDYFEGQTVIHVHGERPQASNHNLIPCPACFRPGLSRRALECPDCGFSMRSYAQELRLRKRMRRETLLSALLLTIAAAVLWWIWTGPHGADAALLDRYVAYAIYGVTGVCALAWLLVWWRFRNR